MRVVATDLRGVDGGGHGAHLHETHLAQGVDHPRVDVEPRHVERLGARRRLGAGAGGEDLAALDHHPPHERLAGEGVDGAAFEHQGAGEESRSRAGDRRGEENDSDRLGGSHQWSSWQL